MLKTELLPPQALELEEAILGACLIFPNAVDAAITLPSEAFYNPKHAHILEAIRRIRANSNPVDILTVKNELRNMGKFDAIGGTVKLMDLADRVAGDANTEYHIEIVKEKFYARRMIQTMQTGINELFKSSDVPGVLEAMDKLSFEILSNRSRREERPMDVIALEYLDSLEKQIASDSYLLGVPSGIPDLDRVTLGYQPTELTIVGARPSMGKTDHGLYVAYKAANMGYKVGFISLEMSDRKLFARLVSMHTGISKGALNMGDKHELTTEDGAMRPDVIQAIDDISKLGISLIDAGVCGLSDIKAHCRRLAKEGCKLIVIDYLGLITLDRAGGKTTNDALAEISRGIKMGVAKEFDVSVIALHQLNRSVETRGGDKRPILSDLRDSGAIEQDADRVYFLYRPDYYGFETDDEGNSMRGKIEYIVAKNREGQTGTVGAWYQPETGRVFDNTFNTANAPF